MRGSFGNFVLGAIIGGIVGASVALLYTPSSGPRLRDQVQDYIQNVRHEVNLAAQNRRSELEHQLDELRAVPPQSSAQ